ncbi:hypothetical protein H8B09_19705 [Paenibacillus sp. PR3]|uniref:AAA+ ATPase domain-containing protein n=1 Tax=Paenibacillus terricola TaxID=2763503 RepID=A0ABR8N0E9_9BACL|nr:protein DpdH [Paenibacillus terricola]MBD3921001.1 hypothetical protein [Paenibacillus terricola]
MQTMNNVTCWNPEQLTRILDPDAWYVDSHLLLATHHPMQMYVHTSGYQPDIKGAVYNEQQFLSDFLKPTEHIFTAILGDAGTGKSHLVRWLKAKIPTNDKRHIVVIPRQTNLKSILLTMLEGLEGKKFEEYRQRINRSSGSNSFEQAKLELLTNLFVCAKPETSSLKPVDEDLTEDLEDFMELLMDALFRPTFLKEDGIIHQLTHHIIGEQSQPGRLTNRRLFTVNDLPIGLIDARGASHRAFTIHQLLRKDEEFQKHAVDWLNKHLDMAIAKMFNFSSDDLIQLLNDIRSEFHNQNMEMVLLIEDFAMMQGIDIQFLQALLLRPGEEKRPLCRLRVAMACTTGYFRNLGDTATSRIKFVVSLDINKHQMTGEGMSDFASRYLNAVRLPEKDTLEWYQAETDQEITSYCTRCEYNKACHEGFGQIDGRGLYPFNRIALETMYDRASGEDNFNPRTMLNMVLHHTLDVYGPALKNGEFPSPSMFHHFNKRDNRIKTITQDQIMSKDRVNGARRHVLLELWANTDQLIDIHPVIHSAFNIAPLQITSKTNQTEIQEKDLEKPAEKKDPVTITPVPIEEQSDMLPQTVVHLMDAVEGWKKDRKNSLGSTDAQNLRKLIFEALNAFIDWPTELLSLQNLEEKLWPVRSISFINQGTNISTNTVTLLLPLKSDDRSWLNTKFALQGLIMYRHYSNWDFPNGPRFFRAVTQQLREWGEVVVNQLKQLPVDAAQSWSPVKAAVEILAIGAGMNGHPVFTDEASVVDSILTQQEEGAYGRSSTWKQLQTEIATNYSDLKKIVLERITCLKGEGRNYSMIDGYTIERTLHEMVPSLQMTSLPLQQSSDYMKLVRLHHKINKSLLSIVKEEQEERKKWIKQMDDLIGDVTDIDQFLTEIKTAIAAATETGYFSGDWEEVQAAVKWIEINEWFNEYVTVKRAIDVGGSEYKVFETLGKLNTPLQSKVEEQFKIIVKALTRSSIQVQQELQKSSKETDVHQLQESKGNIEMTFDLIISMLTDAKEADETV